MLKNYLLVTIRNLLRNKAVSLIHITGFGLGLAAFLFAIQTLIFEYSFDKFHKNVDRIYKITGDYTWQNGFIAKGVATAPALAPILKNTVPEITYAARYIPQLLEEPYCVMTYLDTKGTRKSFNELNARYVDEDFLKIFQFEVFQGNRTPLLNSTSMVMTRSCAQKYFGDENPIGKVLELTTGGTESNKTKFTYQVETVLEHIPANSSLQFDILLPFSAFEDNYKVDVRTNWSWHASFHTFIEVRDSNIDPASLEAKIYQAIPEEVRNNLPATGLKELEYHLKKFSDIHFDSDQSRSFDVTPPIKVIDKSYVFILVLIGFAILVIAEMNYISLTTAKALRRAKEVSIRKISGAGRKHLIGQFLLDACFNIMIGLVFAFTLLQITKPLIAQWLGVSVPHIIDWNYQSILFVPVFIAGVVLMGFIPAYYLSGIFPVSALKGKVNPAPGGGLLRKCLVVFQFTASVALICITYVIVKQLTFMQSKPTGISMDQRIAIRVIGTEDFDLQGFRRFKDRVQNLQSTLSVSAGTSIPGYHEFGSPPWSTLDKNGESHFVSLTQVIVDFDYMKTLDIPLIAGREFTKDRLTDERVCMINETALRSAGFETPDEAIGKSLYFHWAEEKKEVKIIGVVADGNFGSTGRPIGPHVFTFANTTHPFPKYRHYIVHLAPGELDETINTINNVWQEIFPNAPFEYFFVDDGFQRVFVQEKKLQAVAGLSSALAILIACMGLGGLVAYSVTQRTKEIGIRKTLGASVSQILMILSGDFVRLIFLSIAFAIPIGWLAAKQFLESYEYRIQLSIWTFLIPCFVLLFIAIVTISYQTIRAAKSNPVDALKCE